MRPRWPPAPTTVRTPRRARRPHPGAGGDTAFRVALGGHRLTVTHTDGFGVEPFDVDALLVGMGERYDALVTLADGVFPLVALAEGKDATALGLIRTGSGAAPAATVRPRELTGGMMDYNWAFNNRRYDPKRLTPVRTGERVRLRLVNTTMMWHPIHLHGHTFAVAGTGVRKDTANVLPGQTMTVDFDADNPGRWMVHCHNVYHAEGGMMTLFGYQK